MQRIHTKNKKAPSLSALLIYIKNSPFADVRMLVNRLDKKEGRAGATVKSAEKRKRMGGGHYSIATNTAVNYQQAKTFFVGVRHIINNTAH